MSDFFGEYERSLDAKGRIILPAKVREQLEAAGDGHVCLTRGHDGCIDLFPEPMWDDVVEQIKRNRRHQGRAFIRMFFRSAAKLAPDKQGRVMIPEKLLTMAKIDLETDRNVVAIGVMDHFEIWAKSEWELYERRDDEEGWFDEFGGVRDGGPPGGDGDR